MAALETVSTLARRYFGLWVLVGAGVGWILPSSFLWVGSEITWMLGILLFAIGLTMAPSDFRALAQRPIEVLGGVAVQYAVMPLAALVLTLVFDLPLEIAIGVILVGVCPGAASSNILTMLARGDVALSVAITATSAMLAPLMMPTLTIWMIGAEVDVSATALFLSMLEIVVVPVVLGMLTRRLLGERVQLLVVGLPVLSMIVIMAIVAYAMGLNAERLVTISAALTIVVILHNLIGLIAGYWCAKGLGLSAGKRRAYSFEVGMQSSTLAIGLASLHLGPAAALPGALFTLWHNISGPLLATFFAWRDDRKKQPIEAPQASQDHMTPPAARSTVSLRFIGAVRPSIDSVLRVTSGRRQ